MVALGNKDFIIHLYAGTAYEGAPYRNSADSIVNGAVSWLYLLGALGAVNGGDFDGFLWYHIASPFEQGLDGVSC